MGYCDKAYVTINGIVLECSSVKVGGKGKTEPVPTMNKEGLAKGYKRGCKTYQISLSLPMVKGQTDIDLYQVWEDDVEFPIDIEYEGGETHSYLDGTIADIDIESEDAKEVTYALSCLALARVKV